jgi:tetratricopeptide (TPR) repeat protein
LTAEREFRRAIELNPSSAPAHEYYLQYLEAMGKLDEAVKELEILQSVDPGNHFIPAAYYYQRQFSRAIELRRVNVERKAYGASAHYDLAFPLVRVGNYKEAIDEWIETIVAVNYPDMANHLRSGYTSGGFKGAISAWVADLEKLKGSPLIPADLTPYLYALLGDKDRAFAELDSAVRRHDESMLFLKVNPDWDSVRSDRRFADLVHRMGLPQ